MQNIPFKLIRYLFVLRVNSSLLWLPKLPTVNFSQVLARVIADRLPSRQARPWRKALLTVERENYKKGKSSTATGKSVPENPWPIDAILFLYPVKRTYGQDERVLLELKLLGDSADHDMFLEVILPAMEYLGNATDPIHRNGSHLCGNYEIRSVYSAKGSTWKPLVIDGKLDLRRKVFPTQWQAGLSFLPRSTVSLSRVTWLSGFDLPLCRAGWQGPKWSRPKQLPQLDVLLRELLVRFKRILNGGRGDPEDVLKDIDPGLYALYEEALDMARRIPVLKADINRLPAWSPAPWIGSQTFAAAIPRELLPFLGLASILHVGSFVHYGCGAFVLN